MTIFWSSYCPKELWRWLNMTCAPIIYGTVLLKITTSWYQHFLDNHHSCVFIMSREACIFSRCSGGKDTRSLSVSSSQPKIILFVIYLVSPLLIFSLIWTPETSYLPYYWVGIACIYSKICDDSCLLALDNPLFILQQIHWGIPQHVRSHIYLQGGRGIVVHLDLGGLVCVGHGWRAFV